METSGQATREDVYTRHPSSSLVAPWEKPLRWGMGKENLNPAMGNYGIKAFWIAIKQEKERGLKLTLYKQQSNFLNRGIWGRGAPQANGDLALALMTKPPKESRVAEI